MKLKGYRLFLNSTEPVWAKLSPIAECHEVAMKVWRHFLGQNKADLYNYLHPGVDNCEVFK
jgi:hypothetical protein